MYREAQELERSADIDAAEIKFCEALSGFEHLLSATHEDTTAVAYHLASFYAQNDRMKDADAVLDWMTDNYIDRFSDTALQTIEHLLRILDLFSTWSRHEDAKAFLYRIIETMGGDNQQDEPAPSVRIPRSGHTFSKPDSGRMGKLQNQPQPSGTAMLTNDSCEPGVVNLQLGFANGYVKTNDKSAEPFLLNLIEKCESHPTQLASQILRCRSALLQLYHEHDEEKMTEAMGQSREAFWKIFKSEQDKTPSILDAGVEVAKWHVKTGQYGEADDMFIQIQSDAVDTFSTDMSDALVLFCRIGVLYQNEGRWENAEPWFEQALVVCYKVLGEGSSSAKRLEAALENQHYNM
jgi:tetratricopeptide (TPR) repeat protein